MKKLYVPMDVRIRFLTAELDCFEASGDLKDEDEGGSWYPGWDW